MKPVPVESKHACPPSVPLGQREAVLTLALIGRDPVKRCRSDLFFTLAGLIWAQNDTVGQP